MDGVLLINKAEGLSSFDVVRKLKKFLNTKKELNPSALLINKTPSIIKYF